MLGHLNPMQKASRDGGAAVFGGQAGYSMQGAAEIGAFLT